MRTEVVLLCKSQLRYHDMVTAHVFRSRRLTIWIMPDETGQTEVDGNLEKPIPRRGPLKIQFIRHLVNRCGYNYGPSEYSKAWTHNDEKYDKHRVFKLLWKNMGRWRNGFKRWMGQEKCESWVPKWDCLIYGAQLNILPLRPFGMAGNVLKYDDNTE